MIDEPQPTAEIRLTPGNSADLDGVMTIMTAAFEPRFGEAWTRSQCAGILPMPGVSLMLARGADDAPLLGFSLFRSLVGEAELLLLAVDPDHCRRGIGRLLLDEFMRFARADRASRVHLEVRDGNPAVGIYRAAGFDAVGRRRAYYRGSDGARFDALTFARAL